MLQTAVQSIKDFLTMFVNSIYYVWFKNGYAVMSNKSFKNQAELLLSIDSKSISWRIAIGLSSVAR
jgi:hypothetical protein